MENHMERNQHKQANAFIIYNPIFISSQFNKKILFEVTVRCSICWFRWICWPSLFLWIYGIFSSNVKRTLYEAEI